jgi:hypothetical protein
MNAISGHRQKVDQDTLYSTGVTAIRFVYFLRILFTSETYFPYESYDSILEKNILGSQNGVSEVGSSRI